MNIDKLTLVASVNNPAHTRREYSYNRITVLKTINVVAALIVHDGKIFATQRGYGEWRGWWEFPGGKLEAEETPEDALVREIREELATEICVDRHVTTVEWDYPTFHLSMRCYLCSVVSGSLTLLEHEAAAWLDREHLRSVRWLPADEAILDEIESVIR